MGDNNTNKGGILTNLTASLQVGAWMCEAGLWGRWMHRGRMEAAISSEVYMLDAHTFHSIILEGEEQNWPVEPLKTYAIAYGARFGNADAEEVSDIGDPFEATHLAYKCFEEWDQESSLLRKLWFQARSMTRSDLQSTSSLNLNPATPPKVPRAVDWAIGNPNSIDPVARRCAETPAKVESYRNSVRRSRLSVTSTMSSSTSSSITGSPSSSRVRLPRGLSASSRFS